MLQKLLALIAKAKLMLLETLEAHLILEETKSIQMEKAIYLLFNTLLMETIYGGNF